jgi:V8-like Glu-specific endopeptidase
LPDWYGRGMANDASSDRNDLPMTWSEERGWPAEEPTAEVPEELRAVGREFEPAGPKEIQFMERSQSSAEEERGMLASHRPDWVGASVLPTGVKFPEPPRVQHRGIDLNPMTIWQPDDRKPYNDLRHPWVCVCKITDAAGRKGSGVLVGPRHVLTASHCVEWSDRPELIEVHRVGNTSQARAFDTHALAFTRISGDPTFGTVDEDYAVLITNERLGDRFSFLGVKTYDSAWDGDDVWTTIGYPSDLFGGVQPTFQRRKSMDEDEWDVGTGRAMTTAADLKKGQSGSPMFGRWKDGRYVVAVMSSEGTVFASGMENWCSGGSDLTRLVRKARTDFP